MKTLAERIVDVAEGELGVHEVPWGSNTGPEVIQFQRATSLGGTGWPWCAAFVEWVWEQAQLPQEVVKELCSPSTYWMCQNAQQHGAFGTPKVGGAIIWCSQHVGLVVAVGQTVVYTIEGNSGDQVARRTRTIAGARFINPPGLADTPEPVKRWWLEDLGATVKVYGPWAKEGSAKKVYDGLDPETQRIARIVQPGTGGYAIAIGRRNYGPWASKERAVASQAILEARLGRKLRRYIVTSASTPAGPDGDADDMGKTT